MLLLEFPSARLLIGDRLLRVVLCFLPITFHLLMSELILNPNRYKKQLSQTKKRANRFGLALS